MKLREAKRVVRALNFRQLAELDAWLHGLLGAAERTGGHEAMKYSAGHKTYRSEMVRCGKESCKCADGKLHGPYWYAYWTEGGKTKSQYVGKHLPKGVKPPRDAKPRRVR
ncbi:MAG: DUF6788 family protein [Pyrinomonadaceae bacterium]